MEGTNGGVPSGTPPLLYTSKSIDAVPNTPEDRMLENVRANSARRVPWLGVTEPHEGHAVIVGGGPSLRDYLDEIRLRVKDGQVVFALNGAAEFLKSNGIEPDFQVVIDPRIDNIRFVIDRPAKRFLLASQCDPILFRLLEGADVTLFHLAGYDDIESVLPRHTDYLLVGGGIVCGLTSLALVHVMGYRMLHLYGFDSSDSEGQAHAYAQGENRAESERVEVMCAGKVFKTSVPMFKQAEAFPQLARLLANDGATITVHGKGLLPEIARQMAIEPDPAVAVYDLSKAPTSWDFAVWLTAAEMDRRRRKVCEPLRVKFIPGPNGGFRDDDLPGDIESRQRMLDNVLRPMLDLYGAKEEFLSQNGRGFDYQLNQICNHSRSGEGVPIMKPPAWAQEEVDAWLSKNGIVDPLVITLREASHHSQRNSDLSAWLIFAFKRERAGEKVIFVRDTERATEPLGEFTTYPIASLDVRVRCALYERARCNLFVANGPIALAYFGIRPFLIFKPITDDEYTPASEAWWRHNVGVAPGEQYPWSLPTQRIVWEDDTLKNIEKAWADLSPLVAMRPVKAA